MVETSKACAHLSIRVAVAHYDGVLVMEINDEEGQGESGGSNDNSISVVELEMNSIARGTTSQHTHKYGHIGP